MDSPELDILLVHYHTPDLAEAAVSALQADLGLTGLDAEITIVENGSTPEGRARLEGLPARLLTPEDNLGYAGGILHGLEHTTAPLVVAMNPDVMVRPGCLQRLAAEIRRGAAAVGPRFFLDAEERFLIPPTEERTRRAEILARLAERGPLWAERARRRWRRHARRHWQATRPLPTRSLSGALLAFPRRVAEAVPFDPGFHLYFEEDDWQKRLHRAGFAIRHVPGARAVHLYNRSAGAEPRAEEWFARSRERFEKRWYGTLTRMLLRRVSSSKPPRWLPEAEVLPGGPVVERLPESAERLWMELTPRVCGFPAAGELLPEGFSGPWRLPEDVWTGLASGTYWLQAVDGSGRELARWSFTVENAPGRPP